MRKRENEEIVPRASISSFAALPALAVVTQASPPASCSAQTKQGCTKGIKGQETRTGQQQPVLCFVVGSQWTAGPRNECPIPPPRVCVVSWTSPKAVNSAIYLWVLGTQFGDRCKASQLPVFFNTVGLPGESPIILKNLTLTGCGRLHLRFYGNQR